MADKVTKSSLLTCFYSLGEQLSIHQVNKRLSRPIAERTLRRWLSEAVKNGSLSRTGNRKSTKYQKAITSNTLPEFQFLQHKSEDQQQQILKQIRDLWTHTSTAIEGNTLTLGDTHFILEQGLTISGKSLREHQEILGHSRAIDLLYQSISTTIFEIFFSNCINQFKQN